MQEVFLHILDGTNYRQAGDMGKGKMRLRTLHLESVVEMPHDFRGEDIVSMGMGKVKDSWLMPTAFKFLFITLITSGSVSLMHCYLYNLFLEPQSGLPSRLVFLAHKKYVCFLKYFTLLIFLWDFLKCLAITASFLRLRNQCMHVWINSWCKEKLFIFTNKIDFTLRCEKSRFFLRHSVHLTFKSSINLPAFLRFTSLRHRTTLPTYYFLTSPN